VQASLPGASVAILRCQHLTGRAINRTVVQRMSTLVGKAYLSGSNHSGAGPAATSISRTNVRSIRPRALEIATARHSKEPPVHLLQAASELQSSTVQPHHRWPAYRRPRI
jgi:hypothetical protein